jgi:2,3-bisphosphoglycerate-dependent phosphoglycerate mutase
MKNKLLFLFLLLPLLSYSQSIIAYKNPLPKVRANGIITMPDKSTVKIDNFNDKETTVFFIVRHAEKDTAGGTNADLNPIGRGRAIALVKMLKKIQLEKILSTDKPRTRNTAKPIAESKKHAIEIYDPKKHQEVLEKLITENKGKKILMVGHSNTVPQIVNLLMVHPDKIGRGGNEEKEFSELDYSRLYIVSVKKLGEGKVQLIRF